MKKAVRALLVALVAMPRFARADGSDTDRQVAQSLFDDGRARMDAGDYVEACSKFAESHRLDPAGGTILNLALCHELEGKTATALREFRDALSWAARDQRKDREVIAEQHVRDLAPVLMRLTVVVPESLRLREPEITLDDSRLPPAAWTTAIPVDPGNHRVTVKVRGLSPWETFAVTTEPGRSYRVAVPSRVEPCPAGTLPDGDGCRGPSAPGARSRAFWIVLGGAAASLATSAVTGVLALDANAYVSDNCSSERAFCRVSDADDAASRARTLAWISTATLVAGVAAGAAAFLLPRKPPVTVGIGMQSGGSAAFATIGWTPPDLVSVGRSRQVR